MTRRKRVYQSGKEVVKQFVKHGNTDCANQSRNVFVEGDTLYSYGYHFPLLIRMPWGFLMNADRYSVTTSKHQSWCFGSATVQTSFRMLAEAGIDYTDLELIDTEAEYWIDLPYYTTRLYYHGDGITKKCTLKEYDALSPEERTYFYRARERRPQHTVFKVRETYYLTGMDDNSYFISELAEPVKTVKEAFDALEPIEVKAMDYQRQGEWFFVNLPVSNKEAKKTYKVLDRDFALPVQDENSHLHTATRGGFLMDVAFDEPIENLKADTLIVSGQVRHPEHRMLRLSTSKDPKLFAAFRNREVRSWSSGPMGVGID